MCRERVPLSAQVQRVHEVARRPAVRPRVELEGAGVQAEAHVRITITVPNGFYTHERARVRGEELVELFEV